MTNNVQVRGWACEIRGLADGGVRHGQRAVVYGCHDGQAAPHLDAAQRRAHGVRRQPHQTHLCSRRLRPPPQGTVGSIHIFTSAPPDRVGWAFGRPKHCVRTAETGSGSLTTTMRTSSTQIQLASLCRRFTAGFNKTLCTTQAPESSHGNAPTAPRQARGSAPATRRQQTPRVYTTRSARVHQFACPIGRYVLPTALG